jgi:hypothetical protein
MGKLPRLEAGSAIVLKHRKCFCSRNIKNAYAVERHVTDKRTGLNELIY